MNNKKIASIVVPVLVVGVVAGVTATIVININKEDNKGLDKSAQKAKDSDFYKDLTNDEKKQFDDDLKEVTDSDYYKSLDKEEKDTLIDKFVESQKVLHEIKNDEPDVEPESIVIPEDATEEEKAELKQEKAYWETIETVKDKFEGKEDIYNQKSTSVRKVLGIYVDNGIVGSQLYVVLQFVNTETVAGIDYYSLSTEILRVFPDKPFDANISYEQVLEIIDSSSTTKSMSACSNINDPKHIEYFNQNKDFVCEGLSYYLDQGYQVSVYESWEGESVENPDFILKLEKEGAETLYTFSKYYPEYQQTGTPARYGSPVLKRGCEEFWNRLEGKEAQPQGVEATASAQSYETEKGFNYNAYSKKKNQQQTSNQSQDVKVVEGFKFGI